MCVESEWSWAVYIPHQYWKHEFLVWDPDECDGVTRISLPVKELWSPDIIIYELWVHFWACNTYLVMDECMYAHTNASVLTSYISTF